MTDPNDAIDLFALEQRFAGIRQWGDPVLTTPARSVDRFDDALSSQAQQMIEIMDRAAGAGLAAPQVGIAQRLITYYPEHEGPPTVLVNPVVESASSETQVGFEGCLSIGCSMIALRVERAASVRVVANMLDGSPTTFDAVDAHARILQHEIDHLDGVLMLDRVDAEQRRMALRALRLGVAWSAEPAS